jgi:hypothetical protein
MYAPRKGVKCPQYYWHLHAGWDEMDAAMLAVMVKVQQHVRCRRQ